MNAWESSVLIVEDEPEVRACIARALAKEGFRVATASSGEEALRILGARPFDVILTDLRFPGLRGESLVVALTGAALGAAVIAMSADAGERPKPGSPSAGAVTFLVKPLRRETLIRAVEQAARGRAAARHNGAGPHGRAEWGGLEPRLEGDP